MSTFFAVLLAVVGIFLFYTVLAPTVIGMPRFMSSRRLTCPHHAATARVNVDAARAAFTTAYGTPSLRVSRCSLLRRGETCDQACIREFPRAVNA